MGTAGDGLMVETTILVALVLSIVGNIINAWGMIYMKIGHESANAKKLKAMLQRFMELRAAEVAGTKQDSDAHNDTTGSAELSAGFMKECEWWIGMATYGIGSFMH